MKDSFSAPDFFMGCNVLLLRILALALWLIARLAEGLAARSNCAQIPPH
jgi:hypothetical protein